MSDEDWLPGARWSEIKAPKPSHGFWLTAACVFAVGVILWDMGVFS